MKVLKPIGLLPVLALSLASCSDSEVAPVGRVCADITLITPLSGVGDNGYNDQALLGVLESAAQGGMEVSILRPHTLEQAERYATEWSELPAVKRRLLVLPDNEYASVAAKMRCDGLNSVLLFENDGKAVRNEVASFRISRYGVSWLAGALAQGSEVAHAVGGRSDDPTVAEAVSAFAAGFLAKNPEGEFQEHYLSEGYRGYTMPDSLYRLASKYPGDFFFPLAKGSNNGIFKFSRESPLVLMLIAGMDVNCSLYSKRVPFSVLIDIKRAVADYVTSWMGGEEISGHHSFGMADGYASVCLSPVFYTINDIWDGYYSEPDYWENLYGALHEEALIKEKDYETGGL